MTSITPTPNTAAVRQMMRNTTVVEAVRRKDSPHPSFERDGIEAGKWKSSPYETRLGLPKNCPVVPLGLSGNAAFFIDPIGQVQQVVPPYGKGHLLGLFCGDANYLGWAWPRWGKKGIDGFAAEEAAADLVHACAAKGPWSSVDKVRGRGAWIGRDDALVVHTGTKVHRRDGKTERSEPPGEIDGYVYPTRPALPLPWPDSVLGDGNPARVLRPMLRSWQWARPEVDPVLLLGWIGQAYIGGALSWRSNVYITGDKATGKSTLQELVKGLLGEYLIQAVDTTPAGIYQHIGNDSLAVAVDELEGEADARRATGVIKLARIAASGGIMLRGGDRHNPVEFRARSPFLFSSINAPPLEPQDVSRFALLRLARLPAGQAEPDLKAARLTELGRVVMRRMIDEFGRFGETYAAFAGALAAGGITEGRGQKQFATLLACADMIEHDGWSDERLQVATADGDMAAWSDLMAKDRMHEFEDQSENWRLCLDHLLSVQVDAWRNGSRKSVGQILEAAWKREEEPGQVRRLLADAGLGFVVRERGAMDWWLAVPNQHPQVRRLFDGSKWAGNIGAGVWTGALRQSPRGRIHEVEKQRVGGVLQQCTLISLAGLYSNFGIMVDRKEGEDDDGWR